MFLYLVRHAIAEDSAASGRDADRALTADGAEKMHRIAQGLRTLELQLDRVLTSPFRRAVETAEILASVFDDTAIEILPHLAAGAEPAAVLSALKPYARVGALALVGHQPDLGTIASQILTGSPTACRLPFKKGGVACVQIDTPRAALRGELGWFMTPKQLRAVRGD